MRDAGGYSIITNPDGRPIEHDLGKCPHCQAVEFFKAGAGPSQIMVFRADGSHYLIEARRCPRCFQYICPKKECNRDCVPFEKKLDEEERNARRFVCERS